MSADDRLREVFVELAPPVEPAAESRERARAALHRAMRAADATDAAPSRRQRRRVPALGWAAAAVAGVVVAAVLVLPGSTPAVDANLANIARAARTITAEELPPGSYLYVHIDSVTFAGDFGQEESLGISYLLRESIDVWVRGSSYHEQRTGLPPIFAEPSDEAAYYASDLPTHDGVGVTTPVSAEAVPNLVDTSKLSTSTDALRGQLRNALALDPDWSANSDGRTMDHIAELMDPRSGASTKLRAALLELLGELDVTTAKLPGGGVSATLEYDDNGTVWRHRLEFDATGHLRLDLLEVVDTAPGSGYVVGLFSNTSFSLPSIVSAPGRLP